MLSTARPLYISGHSDSARDELERTIVQLSTKCGRQIDEHRSTDRVVVLDFPLLGENPRKGLAATIVVDIPVDVAVRRLVDQRGMDEADARARINSQLSREERLATATHVIDNGGDRDSLTAQVDELWEQLLELLPADA